MRIPLLVDLIMKVPDSKLQAYHDLAVEIRDELKIDPDDNMAFWNQVIQQAEDKISYLSRRQNEIKQAEIERREYEQQKKAAYQRTNLP